MKYTTLGCLLILLLIIGCNFLMTWIVQMLWNSVMPIFWEGAPALTFWQTFGCMILITIISGTIRGLGNSKD